MHRYSDAWHIKFSISAVSVLWYRWNKRGWKRLPCIIKAPTHIKTTLSIFFFSPKTKGLMWTCSCLLLDHPDYIFFFMKPFILRQFSRPGETGLAGEHCLLSAATQLRTLKKNVGIVSRYQHVVDLILFLYSFCVSRIVSEAKMCSVKTALKHYAICLILPFWSAQQEKKKLHSHCTAHWTAVQEGLVLRGLWVCLSVYSRNRTSGRYYPLFPALHAALR